MRRRSGFASSLALMVGLAVLMLPWPANAQELEPKSYAASPVGAAFLVVGATRSTGDVVFDATLPLRDVNAKIGATVLGGGYTFGLAHRLALVTAVLPYTVGDISGLVGEDARETSRSGLADARVKFSVNFIGNPAQRAREFAKAPRKTIVGASLLVIAPSGQYYPAKLINLGANRWSFKSEIGVAVPKGRWDFDAYLAAWLFTGNYDYYPGGLKRSQDLITALQVHASYTARPRFWMAVDATWYAGGASRVDGGPPAGRLNNSRIGGTLSLPVGARQSIKLAYGSGMAVRTGSNFRTVSVAWQCLWLTRP